MPPPVSYTKFQFQNTPLFAADFDPYDRGYLIVGGGGGESRTGVGNILALLDISSPSDIKTVAQIELSKNEDSPQSLACLPVQDGVIALAGINSSNTDRKGGTNQHLRTFMVKFPSRTNVQDGNDTATDATQDTTTSSIKLVAQDSFFAPATGPKAFQRLMRLSPVRSRDSGSKRLGAIAPGDAQRNEIIVFNATSAPPDQSSVCARVEPSGGAEAVDLDINHIKGDQFDLAYCTDDSVFLYSLTYDFNSRTHQAITNEPVSVLKLDRPKSGTRSTLRCLRWLGPKHILLLVKKSIGGADLVIILLKADNSAGTIILRQPLPKSLVVAAQMDICHLDGDAGTGDRQIIIAVAGQHRNGDAQVHILTLDHRPLQPTSDKHVARLNPVTILQGPKESWHTSAVMSLAFTNFFPPRQSPTSTMSIATSTQHVKLASVAWGGSVVVDTFSLTSTPTSPSATPEASATESAGSPSIRWVLTSNSLTERLTSRSGLIILALSALVFAILVQSYITLSGNPNSALSTASSVFSNLRPPGEIPYQGQQAPANVVASTVTSSPHRLRDLLHLRHVKSSSPSSDTNGVTNSDTTNNNDETFQHHILVTPSTSASDNFLSTTLHPPKDLAALKAKGAKAFKDMAKEEQETWMRRLREIGEWDESLPRTILQSVLFSEWVGLMAGIANH